MPPSAMPARSTSARCSAARRRPAGVLHESDATTAGRDTPVTRSRDRDAVVDRLLAAAPQDQGEPTEDCLDAGTIAALADGGLSAAERGASMDHVAACSHCQAVLAAVIRTTPEPAPGRAWWRLRPWPWLVPALGGATAL